MSDQTETDDQTDVGPRAGRAAEAPVTEQQRRAEDGPDGADERR